MKKLFCLIAAVGLSFAIRTANAATFDWTWTGSGTFSSGSGTLDAPATGGLITDFTGTFIGFSTTLLPPLTYLGNDNMLSYPTTPYLDLQGVSFSLSNGDVVNIHFNGGYLATDAILSPGTFSVTITPLPAALPLFATGLGALGLLGWRRKRNSRGAP